MNLQKNHLKSQIIKHNRMLNKTNDFEVRSKQNKIIKKLKLDLAILEEREE